MCRLPLLAALAVAVAVLGVPEAAAQTVVCPSPPTQANFDADKYLGAWYEMKRVPRNFEDDGECGMATYSWLDATAKTAVNVLNTNYVPKTMSVSSVTLQAQPVDLPNGKLNVVFPNLQVPASPYWVLGTDYTNYAVVYSCSVDKAVIVPHITLWVLARDPAKYTSDVDATVNALIKNAGLDASILKTVEHHTGCPAATCKPCASPKASLDLAKLKGRWAEVQHSPFATDSDKQTCSLGEFTATTDGVRFNATTYQAVSETAGAERTLELIGKWTDSTKKDGSFEVTSAAGTGKMCVLGTDYDNWAVVSVCIPPTPTTTAAPVGPFATPSPATSGGVFVMSRKRGLTPAQQMEANKYVVNAGVPAASMQTTPATPCPAVALEGNVVSSAAGASVTPAILVASLLAAVLGHLRPAQ
ncbi:uncharacterized protein LOC117645119 [Thrips palmi]|uniref:Uncharacterized protein LOC117645119 n=1 Tax=Thrips palmi TaxID=161013 RepID=A0A6P8YUW4_THRPL|nr:uncharacterized protein LOC117645119 [Thrips palmi]